MFCIKCGTKLPDGVKFCPNCGVYVAPMMQTKTSVEATPNVEVKPMGPQPISLGQAALLVATILLAHLFVVTIPLLWIWYIYLASRDQATYKKPDLVSFARANLCLEGLFVVVVLFFIVVMPWVFGLNG